MTLFIQIFQKYVTQRCNILLSFLHAEFFPLWMVITMAEIAKKKKSRKQSIDGALLNFVCIIHVRGIHYSPIKNIHAKTHIFFYQLKEIKAL